MSIHRAAEGYLRYRGAPQIEIYNDSDPKGRLVAGNYPDIRQSIRYQV